MKELFKKKFWQDIKRTFDEAREDTPAKPPQAELQAPEPTEQIPAEPEPPTQGS